MSHPRVVAIDYGTKRVGIAISDPLKLFAQPLGTFDAAGAVDALRTVRDTDGLDCIVIGWPLAEDGKEGVATRRVDEFVRRLRNALGKITVVRWDERHSSEAARDGLKERGQSVRKGGANGKSPAEAGRLDQAVAGMLLQEYLDSVGMTGSPS